MSDDHEFTELAQIYTLSNVPGLGPLTYKKLRDHYLLGDLCDMNAEDLKKARLLGRINPYEFDKKSVEKSCYEIEKILGQGISILSVESPKYPSLLREIAVPPLLLYMRGKFRHEGILLSMVGSRKMTPYGKSIIEHLVPELVRSGVGIISGLALGVDSESHRETLRSGGYTLGVLGSGINRISPRSNSRLAEEVISSGGAIISEYHPDEEARPEYFPQRNRIIAGLSDGTLVVEAMKKSGSLITARCALEEGREVFAVPGNIFQTSSVGGNELISRGAKPVWNASGVLESFGREVISQSLSTYSDEEKALIDLLLESPKTLDQLIEKSSEGNIHSLLTMMEIRGSVKRKLTGEFVFVGG